MPKGYVRKRCVDCRRVSSGKAGRIEWCDCGGEMVEMVYRSPRRKARRRG